MAEELYGDAPFLRAGDRRMELARQWDDLVEQVRQLPGFADFLRPPPVDDLLAVGVDGPVVLINVSRWRCDALVVEPDGARSIPLPDLTSESVIDRVQRYLAVSIELENAAAAVRHARAAASADGAGIEAVLQYSDAKVRAKYAAENRDQVLTATMEWQWDLVAQPILRDLRLMEPAGRDTPRPRIWWCPTGALSLLPIHAAGYHNRGSGFAVLDHVVSSYTPSLRALKLAKSAPIYPTGPGAREGTDRVRNEMLFVSVANTPGQVPLLGSQREADLMNDLFAQSCTSVRDLDATRAKVRTEMARHPWVHFSCHGDQNLSDPSSGGILLSDGVLTIGDISSQAHDGEFAFLSACKTAVGGVHLPDEAITLTAALHYTGYRHVIGTLWSVPDTTAVDIAHILYPELVADNVLNPERSAYALHKAITALRNAGRPVHSWSPFTHTGP